MTHSALVLVANSGDGSISVFRLSEGSLERLAVTEGLVGCSAFAIDADRDLVYAAVKAGGEHEHAGVATLALDRETGRLTHRSRLDLPVGGMNYLSLTRGGTGLLGAAYGAGYGFSATIQDGVVASPVSRIEFANLHAVLPSDDGRFAYFVSLGDDLIAQYSIDGEMRLHPLDPETVPAPAGSGPRHLVLSEAQDAVYVLTEFSGEVLHYARDTVTGTLDLRGSASAVDPGKNLGHSRFGIHPLEHHVIWGADIHIGEGGRRLWCSERTESTLAAVEVADDGSLSAPTRFFTTEEQPRGFAVSPDGAFLVAAGERSTTVSLYAVDGDRLELRQRIETGAVANWVRFV
ncbi:lactonase family protein [Microbacterium sp. SLBN-146]|uniref:lactonase family protein n=1 Tax=Microbacterium sp. SLBN-146 TaxID=2768457 RepID=UPI001170E9F0|nr:lactonase family protein [Microbacterium sp. SLBN-146]TQJ31281.1 6-phosphogluconolactonase [Microbacterium sp. SLBN-146]